MKGSRVILLFVIFVAITAVISLRLFAVQILSHEFYRDLADGQHHAFKTLVPERGEIYIHDESSGDIVPLATNIERNLAYAVPPEIADKNTTAVLLSKALGLDKSEIFERINQDDRQWVAIKKQLTESESQAVSELDLDGIYLYPETYRYYTENNFASQVLGFVGFQGDERTGQYGLEREFDEVLSGRQGSLAMERDAFGRWISRGLREVQPASDGSDIVLTLNRAIQHKAESILSKTVSQHQADSGSIVIMNPKSGAILAMANFPSFDPNEYNKIEDQSAFRNRVVSDPYEPGSVFKPITMAAALDADVVTPETVYEDTGAVTIGKYTIKNSDNKAHGQQNMVQVLEQSLNTGVIFVQDQLGPEKFLDKVKGFGFGEKIGIGLPNEEDGDISNLIGGGDIHYATASFGQGITATLLQLLQSYGVLANGGELVRPYIVESMIDSAGNRVEYERKPGRRVISSRAANTAAAMMVSVVENGHGKKAGVPGYYVAGKTGTAQVAGQTAAGYDPNITIGTFAGFAPVNDPAFVMVVRIDNPKTVRFAESTAAPAFGEMAQFLLNYFQIPTSR